MSKIDLFKYCQNMKNKNSALSFMGTVSQDILVGLKELMENQFSKGTSHNRSAKKAFSVMIELSQNVLHHSAEKMRTEGGVDIGVGIVSICETDNGYEISSGNKIDNSSLPELLKHCDHINSLDLKELKKLYQDRLRMPLDEKHGSPRLGLIDIIKKSGNPIKLDTTYINDQYSFLTVSAIIKKECKNG